MGDTIEIEEGVAGYTENIRTAGAVSDSISRCTSQGHPQD